MEKNALIITLGMLHCLKTEMQRGGETLVRKKLVSWQKPSHCLPPFLFPEADSLSHTALVSRVTEHNTLTFNWPSAGEEEGRGKEQTEEKEEEEDTGWGDVSSGCDKSCSEGDGNLERKGVEGGIERNKEVGREERRGEDRGKRWGGISPFFTLTFPLFLTSKNLLVRRNYSPPLNRTALLHHCFLPTGPPPLQPPSRPHLLTASRENGLVNGMLRAIFKLWGFYSWCIEGMTSTLPVGCCFLLVWKIPSLFLTSAQGFCANFPLSKPHKPQGTAGFPGD